jgi:hypothetical protein
MHSHHALLKCDQVLQARWICQHILLHDVECAVVPWPTRRTSVPLQLCAPLDMQPLAGETAGQKAGSGQWGTWGGSKLSGSAASRQEAQQKPPEQGHPEGCCFHAGGVLLGSQQEVAQQLQAAGRPAGQQHLQRPTPSCHNITVKTLILRQFLRLHVLALKY